MASDLDADTSNFYWANRLAGALADAHYAACISHVERYQLKLASEGHRLLKEFDMAYQAKPAEDVTAYLTECNQKIADTAQALTTDLLNNKDYLEQVYKEGAQKASYLARKTLDKVYRKVGFVAR